MEFTCDLKTHTWSHKYNDNKRFSIKIGLNVTPIANFFDTLQNYDPLDLDIFGAVPYIRDTHDPHFSYYFCSILENKWQWGTWQDVCIMGQCLNDFVYETLLTELMDRIAKLEVKCNEAEAKAETVKAAKAEAAKPKKRSKKNTTHSHPTKETSDAVMDK
jgi:hypothetical protein